MRRLISPEEMQACEKRYFESASSPSINTMERAADALVQAVLFHFPEVKRVFIACGPGGNGGDGYACARLLVQRGVACDIFASAPAKNADAIENARRARSAGIKIHEDILPDLRPELWIDCLYGTGLSRAPEGRSAELIRRMNRDRISGSRIVAADIPSGLNGRTGAAYDPCVQADATVAFQFAKYGHFLQDGLDMCGEIWIVDVGLPMEAFDSANLPRLAFLDDLSILLPVRRRNMHKGDCGRLLIVAGSVGMAGAAALCAQAALRSGVGLVSIACPQEIVPILQTHAPCATCIPLPQKDGALSIEAFTPLKAALKGKNAVVIGPGLSRKTPSELIAAVLESGLPAVIDADALNLIAANDSLKRLLKPHHALTPHPAEAARLLGRPCTDPIADAQALSRMGALAILKGASRVICGENGCIVSASGAGGMARGGSGDVFAGILGALLSAPDACSARHLNLIAAAACELHGLAGALAQEKYGNYAMNAADILEFLPEVFKRHAR